jgi:hypothetical protein
VAGAVSVWLDQIMDSINTRDNSQINQSKESRLSRKEICMAFELVNTEAKIIS